MVRLRRVSRRHAWEHGAGPGPAGRGIERRTRRPWDGHLFGCEHGTLRSAATSRRNTSATIPRRFRARSSWAATPAAGWAVATRAAAQPSVVCEPLESVRGFRRHAPGFRRSRKRDERLGRLADLRHLDYKLALRRLHPTRAKAIPQPRW